MVKTSDKPIFIQFDRSGPIDYFHMEFSNDDKVDFIRIRYRTGTVNFYKNPPYNKVYDIVEQVADQIEGINKYEYDTCSTIICDQISPKLKNIIQTIVREEIWELKR